MPHYWYRIELNSPPAIGAAEKRDPVKLKQKLHDIAKDHPGLALEELFLIQNENAAYALYHGVTESSARELKSELGGEATELLLVEERADWNRSGGGRRAD